MNARWFGVNSWSGIGSQREFAFVSSPISTDKPNQSLIYVYKYIIVFLFPSLIIIFISDTFFSFHSSSSPSLTIRIPAPYYPIPSITFHL